MGYQIGERIHFNTWEELKKAALTLQEKGYSPRVNGWEDMSANILTIMATPEEEEK